MYFREDCWVDISHVILHSGLRHISYGFNLYSQQTSKRKFQARVYSHTRTMFQMMLQGCLKLTQVRKFKVKVSSQTLFPTSSFLAFGKWRFHVAAVPLVLTSRTCFQIIPKMPLKTLWNKLVFSQGCCWSFKVTLKKQNKTNKLDQIKKFPHLVLMTRCIFGVYMTPQIL